jgi:hypothetical protein
MDFSPYPSRYSLLKLDCHGNQLSATVEVGSGLRKATAMLLLLLFASLLSPRVHFSSPALTDLCLELA